MVFGFFKKKESKPADGMSSRRRRMISSQKAPVVKPGQKPSGRTATAASSKKEPVAPAPRKDVGQLKRGEASSLLIAGDIEQADEALKDFVIEAGLGEADKVEDAFTRKTDKSPFISIIVDEEIVNQNELLVELSKKCMIPQGKLEKYRIRKKALECLDAESSLKLMILPVDKLGQILSVAMVNPLNTKAIKNLSETTGLRVKTVVCTYTGFMEQYQTHYGAGGQVEGSEESLDISVAEPEAISPDEFKKMMSKASDKAKQVAPSKPDPAASTEKKTVAAPPAIPEPAPAPAPAPEPVPEPEVAEAEEVIEVADEDVVEVLDAEDVELVFDEPEAVEAEELPPPPAEMPPAPEPIPAAEFIEPELEGPQILEPLIEGIDLSEDDDEELTIEPMIISAEDVESDAILDISLEPGEIETVDAIGVVEEEFNQGIRLGAVDLFKKWEGLHRKQRIITLKQIPEDIFTFIVS